MKNFQKYFKFLLNLKFAIGILFLIAFFSSLGSILEQDQSKSFYLENYNSNSKLYGFLDSSFIFFFGLDHIYRTWWFIFLLVILSCSLISCTFVRQFPLVELSKLFFFKKKISSFQELPFFVRFYKYHYLKEIFSLQLQNLEFSIFQKKNFLYAYKGLIGRVSPIIVHISLLIILSASGFSTIENFKSQEIIPKSETFKIQNIIKAGYLTNLPQINARINDFWIEYKNQKINQFYSDLSLVDNFANEMIQQSISVNNPLRYKNIDFYQSDWNLEGIRIEKNSTKEIIEYPLFSLNQDKKWVTWIYLNKENYTLIFEKLDNTFFVYDSEGKFLFRKQLNSIINNDFSVIEVLPSTGLLMKYDPTIPFIYLGFGLLIFTTLLSYLPYTQIWISNYKKPLFLIGATTNRGRIQIEIIFENFLRLSQNIVLKRKDKDFVLF